ncbi:MAG: TonB-dependent receptor plug domain-containing protein [Bacteroidota bacterium]
MQMLPLVAQKNKASTIQGKVTGTSREPLIYTQVMIDSLGLRTATDLERNYILKDVLSGTYQLSGHIFRFQTAAKTVEVKEGALTSINFTLQEDIRSLDKMVISVESEKEKQENSSEAVEVIENKEVKLQSANLREVVAKTEGISAQLDGGQGSNTQFAFIELSGDQIRFFDKGIPLNFNPYAFGIANVPINAINHVEVHKGIVTIQFGADALGGTVNLVLPFIYGGWPRAVSYQVGSFNTHRIIVNLAYASDSSSWVFTEDGFYDFADNNYKIDVAIPNKPEKLQPQTVERFHDGYRVYSAHLKAGIKNKTWAKELGLQGN